MPDRREAHDILLQTERQGCQWLKATDESKTKAEPLDQCAVWNDPASPR